MATNAEHQKAWRRRRKAELEALRKGGQAGSGEGDGAAEVLTKAREEIGRLRKELAEAQAVALRKEQAPETGTHPEPAAAGPLTFPSYYRSGPGCEDVPAIQIGRWLEAELMADRLSPLSLDLIGHNAKTLALKWWAYGGGKRTKRPRENMRSVEEQRFEEQVQAEFRRRMDDVWKLVKEKEEHADMIIERDRVRGGGGGLMTKAEFMQIMKCLHSDRLNGVDKAELDAAHRLFMGFRAKLIKIEPADDGRPRPPPLPKTAEEWRACRRKRG